MTSSLKLMAAALGLALATTASTGYARNAKHAAVGCPPGLAKKTPPCVPPGQANKDHGTPDNRKYHVGERIDDTYVWIETPGGFGLRHGAYLGAGDFVYRVNRETREVQNLIGAVVDVLD